MKFLQKVNYHHAYQTSTCYYYIIIHCQQIRRQCTLPLPMSNMKSADQGTIHQFPAYVQHEVSRSGYNTPVPCLCPKWSQQIRVQCTSSLPRSNMKSVDQGTVHPTHMFPVYIQNDRAQFFGELTSLSRVMQWLEIKIIWFPTKRGELSVLFEGPNKAMLRT